MKRRVPREVVPYLVALGAAAIVICLLPGDLGVLSRLGLLTVAGAILVGKVWPQK